MPLKLSCALILSVLVLGISSASPQESESPSPDPRSKQTLTDTPQPSDTSDHPSPSGRVSSQPVQDKPSEDKQQRDAEQHSTEKFTIFEKTTVDAEKDHDASQSSEAHQDDKPAINNAVKQTQIDLAYYTGWLAWVTLALAVVALGQVLLFYVYLKLIRKSLRATEQAAEAAKSSARAVMLEQRAYVRISHTPRGLRELNEPRSGYQINILIENIGKTPARLTDMVLTSTCVPPNRYLPVPAVYPIDKHTDDFPRFLYGGDDERKALWDFPFTPAEKAEIESGATVLCIYGYIDYIDTFEVRHRSGYGRWYSPPSLKDENLNFVVEPSYNYDRERKKGEGNDWPTPTT